MAVASVLLAPAPLAVPAASTAAERPPSARRPAAAIPPTPWFLRYPTDQLGVPGDIETAELTPTNSLFTGRLELALRSGPGLTRWDEGERELDPAGLPVYRWTRPATARGAGGVAARGTAFAVAGPDDVPVVHLRVQVENPSAVPRRYGIGLDQGWLGEGLAETLKGDLRRAPFRFPRNVPSSGVGLLEQPGDPFDPGWTTGWSGPVLLRSGSPLLAARVADAGQAGRGPRIVRLAGPSVRPDAVTARVRITGTLRPGESRRVDVVVPLRAVPVGHPALADGFDRGLRRLRAAWGPVLARGMKVSTPDPDLNRAWKAGVLAMLVPRYRLPDGRWVQTVNKFQYQASWIRDTAMIAHALNLLGFGREAGEDVEFLTRWQDGTGLLQSREGQRDGMGQALWAFGDHAVRSRDRALAVRLLPAVDRAMAYLRRRLAEDPKWVLPASDPKDDGEHAVGHAAGDLAWIAGGTRRVVGLAELLDDDERIEAWSAIADEVGAIARRRVREAARDGVVPPVLDAAAGRRWGEMWIAWPTRLLAPRDPLVRATMAAAARDEREGLALWGGRLHLYLGLRRLHTELRAGRREQAIAGLHSALAHLTSTGGTWEQAAVPYGSREVYRALGPHAWAAADLLALVHDMLVREDGDGVRLLDAVPPGWLRAGRVTRVRGARTALGRVDVELRATPSGATLRWDADVPAGTPLRFRAPRGTVDVRLPGVAPGRRELVLPARRGSLELRWRTGRRVRDAPDTAAVRRALQATYVAQRGRR